MQVESNFSSQSRRVTEGLKAPAGQLARNPLLLTHYTLCAHHKLSLRRSCGCPYRTEFWFCQAITPTCQITLSCAAITEGTQELSFLLSESSVNIFPTL